MTARVLGFIVFWSLRQSTLWRLFPPIQLALEIARGRARLNDERQNTYEGAPPSVLFVRCIPAYQPQLSTCSATVHVATFDSGMVAPPIAVAHASADFTLTSQGRPFS